jgi:tRNA(adenine34) deaminase
MNDSQWMMIALEEARAAAAAGDVPVGAIVVSPADGAILGRGRNRRELDRDPTAHAEVIALRDAAKTIGHWRVEATMFVTQEPCPMCAGALVNARVSRLVYGCPNPKAGAITTLYELASDPRLNHRVAEIEGGVLAEDCAQVLQQFFADLRRGPTYR